MDHLHENRFVVFVRDGGDPHRPDSSESPLTSYGGHAEARRACRRLRAQGLDCVVRFVGPSGGGD